MLFKVVYFLCIISINSLVFAEIVYPKIFNKSDRLKREINNKIFVDISGWILEYQENKKFKLSDKYEVQNAERKLENYDANCKYLIGGIINITSQSVVTICNDQLLGFVRIGSDYYFIEPVSEDSGAHFLNKHNFSRKKREVASVCFTSEFYNLTEIHYDETSELDEKSEENTEFVQKLNYENNLQNDVGYFYDSAWEAHLYKKRPNKKIATSQKWLEIAVGVDYSVVQFHGRNKVQRYLLSLMNIVSAIYQDPSLDANMQLVLTRVILYDQKKYSIIKVGNALKSLQNVNQWNKKLHMTLDKNDQRHDMAIFLTRLDIGGPSGYAPIAGTCDPSRSCTLNRDEGLTSAFIIAHEMAHVLGLTHDGDTNANNSCVQEANDGSVMAPMVASKFNKFSWSSCSKKEFHYRAAQWYCLKNPPIGKTEVILTPNLLTSFSMDEQCRMEFGEGYKMCSAFNVWDPCSHLWCEHENSTLVCKTKRGPPLDGTQCAPNKYCLKGYCTSDTFGYQLDSILHNPQDGEWSEWSSWTPCSRTCNFGVQFRTRFCNNPPPAYGGIYCKGPSEEFKVCGNNSCSNYLNDFRAEQCSRLPKLIDDVTKLNMTWLPYESEKKSQKCQLICISKQTGEIFNSGENLIDGTLCSYDEESDICVQGHCHQINCLGTESKDIIEDSCGVCGGNNSNCVDFTSNFHRNIKREISRIGVIPGLSRNIKIECRLNTIRNISEISAFFIMRDRLKGIRYNLTVSKDKYINYFIVNGAKFHYSIKEGALKFWSRGPLLNEIIVSLYVSASTVNSGVGMTISSSFTLNRNNIQKKSRFKWIKGGWGPCSSSCGGGTKIQTLACKDSRSNRIVTKKHCSLSQKPKLLTDKCNNFRFHWIPGPWEYCTQTCGLKGVQSREIYCVHHSIKESISNISSSDAVRNLIEQAVSPARCSDPYPQISRNCNRFPCLGHWEPAEWSQCSESCGMGKSFRDFYCSPFKNDTVFTCGPKPETQVRKCRNENNRKNNPQCKNISRKSCIKDKFEVCGLKDYLGKYCIIPKFRRICCKMCFNTM